MSMMLASSLNLLSYYELGLCLYPNAPGIILSFACNIHICLSILINLAKKPISIHSRGS